MRALIGLVVLVLLAGLPLALAACRSAPWKSVDEKGVTNLVAAMTLEEKVGQMTQVDRKFLEDEGDIARYNLGSLLSGGGSTPTPNEPPAWAAMLDRYQAIAATTRLKVPLLYSIDAVHGHNNVVLATVFPHNIGLGATRDEALVREVGRITASEVRATGINWVFAPCLAVSRDERWGRAYESFSEDPALAAKLGLASIQGLQGGSLVAPGSVAACAKHFAGDGGTSWGTGVGGKIDQGDTRVSEAELRRIHLPVYEESIRGGVATAMASYSSWNGAKCHGNKTLLTGVLRGELGFPGLLVSDWRGIDQLPGDYRSDIVESINAGIDMVMVPGAVPEGGVSYKEFIRLLLAAVRDGSISQARIDEAVARILRVKARMGLLKGGYRRDSSLLDEVGSASHRAVARQAVRESLVLLKDDGATLPFRPGKRIAVAGRAADDIGIQCGGWTVTWQGGAGPVTRGTTIFGALKKRAAKEGDVFLAPDAAAAKGASAAVVVIGEMPYAEMMGDREMLALDPKDATLVKEFRAQGIPTVVVLVSGRPLVLDSAVLDGPGALVAAWLPGTEGDGIADVLLGDADFTGKLPVSWPKTMEQVPVNVGDAGYAPLFPFGHGLRYGDRRR